MDDIFKNADEKNQLMKIYQIAVESVGAVVFLYDSKKMTVEMVDSTADVWRVQPVQTGVPYEIVKTDIVLEDSKKEYVRVHEEIINGAKIAKGRVRFRALSGRLGEYDLCLTALLDENGEPTGKAAGIYRDITVYEENYLHQYVLARALAEGVSSAYYVDFDNDTYRIERMTDETPSEVAELFDNPQFCFSEMIEKYCLNFVEEDDRERLSREFKKEIIEEKLRTRSSYFVQFKIKDPNENKGYYEIHISNAATRPTQHRAFLSFRCIDEQREKELEQKRALEDAFKAANIASSAKTDFLSKMSHDIRTPLNAIIGMTAIACTHIDDKERLQDCLSKITISSKHLLGLINEVLDMSKIESGKLDLHMEDFDLVELVDNLVSMTQPLVQQKDHDLKVDVHGISHELVTGDSQRLQQAFMNIMGNAIKYTPEGGMIRLSITEKPTNKNHIGCYEFIFEDNGIGMSEEFQEHIFEPFAREMDSRVDKVSGTGLGMPITKNIVQMMNGDIEVESAVGKGTKVTVTIFLQLQNVNSEFSSDMLIDLPVLIADDDRITCESACDMLGEIGMKGEWVLSGAEAVDKVMKRHEKAADYFAVILDWKMPGMDGVATTKAIRKAIGDDIPIIIISAYDWSDIELEARKAGANAFISKPLFKSRVVHTFRSLIEKQSKDENVLAGTLEQIKNSDFSGRKVLLVEDDELNAEIAAEILGMAKLEIEFAVDGKQAVDKMIEIADDYYDMVFMDIQMPVMNGYEATRAIRSINRDYLKRVPIIALTANAFAEDVEAARDVGMNEHIAKPIEFAQLLEVLNRWIG